MRRRGMASVGGRTGTSHDRHAVAGPAGEGDFSGHSLAPVLARLIQADERGERRRHASDQIDFQSRRWRQQPDATGQQAPHGSGLASTGGAWTCAGFSKVSCDAVWLQRSQGPEEAGFSGTLGGVFSSSSCRPVQRLPWGAIVGQAWGAGVAVGRDSAEDHHKGWSRARGHPPQQCGGGERAARAEGMDAWGSVSAVIVSSSEAECHAMSAVSWADFSEF